METKRKQNMLLVDYLLNDLSEQEREGVEERYFHEDELLFELLETEAQLIREYAHGRMSAQERDRFETAYLATERGREQLDHFRALERWADARGDSGAQNSLPPPGFLLYRLFRLFRLFNTGRFLWNHPLPSFAGLALLLALCAWLLMPLRNGQEDRAGVEKSVRPLIGNHPTTPSTTRTPPAETTGDVTLLLELRISDDRKSIVPERSSGPGQETSSFLKGSSTKFLKMKLRLRPPIFLRYQGRLLDKNKRFTEIAREEVLKTTRSGDARYIYWQLGADIVPEGDYQVELQGISPTGIKGDSNFYDFKLRSR